MKSTQTPPQPAALVRLALLFYGALLAAAWLVATLADQSLFFRDVPSQAAGVDWPADLASGLAAAAAVVVLSGLVERHTQAGRVLARALTSLLGPLRTGHCLLLAALSGVAEEALFRGALQPLVGLVCASLLFGLAHFVPRRDLWPWALFTFAAGLLLGGLYEWTGNLVAPVVAHAGINAVNLRRLALRFEPRS